MLDLKREINRILSKNITKDFFVGVEKQDGSYKILVALTDENLFYYVKEVEVYKFLGKLQEVFTKEEKKL